MVSDYNVEQVKPKGEFWKGFSVASGLMFFVILGLILLGFKLSVFSQKCMLF